MTFNQKNNAVHVNLLKLALGLKTDPETARLMRSSTRARVDAMAARIQPLLHAADDNAGLAVLSRTAALAAVRARDALKMMHTAVQFQYPVLPEALTALGRLRLGETPQENLTRLQALLAAVRTLPNFMYPPGMTAGGVTAVASEHAQAQAALAAAKFRVSSAAQELRELRPAVKSLWKDLALTEWIKSNVEGHDAQLAFGLSRKKRRKAAGDGTRVEPVTPAVKDVAMEVVTEVLQANTPPPVVEIPVPTTPTAYSPGPPVSLLEHPGRMDATLVGDTIEVGHRAGPGAPSVGERVSRARRVSQPGYLPERHRNVVNRGCGDSAWPLGYRLLRG